MKYLQSFWGPRPWAATRGLPWTCWWLTAPQTPNCICNDLRSLHIVPSAQYLAAPSTPSRTETFPHTKISLRLSKKNSALQKKEKNNCTKESGGKNFLTSVKNYSPLPPLPSPLPLPENQMVRP